MKKRISGIAGNGIGILPVCLFICVAIAACSGGGGGSSNSSSDSSDNNNNSSLRIVTLSFSESENEDVSFEIDARGGDGSNVVYSITGGDDGDFFTIDGSSGLVEGDEPFDFEVPLDEDEDNVYEIEITARDDSGSDAEDVLLRIIDDAGDETRKLSGTLVSGNAGAVMTSTPDYDGDEVDDLILAIAKAGGESHDVVGYLLFSEELADPDDGIRGGEEFFLDETPDFDGIEFTLASLRTSDEAFPLAERAETGRDGPFAAIGSRVNDDPDEEVIARIFPTRDNEIAGRESRIDIGTVPDSDAIATSENRATLRDLDDDLFPVYEEFNADGVEILERIVGDVTGDGVRDVAVVVGERTGDDDDSDNLIDEGFVVLVSGAALNADSDGIIDEADLDGDEIFFIVLDEDLIGSSGVIVNFGSNVSEVGTSASDLNSSVSQDVNDDGFDELVITQVDVRSRIARTYIIDGEALTEDSGGDLELEDFVRSRDDGLLLAQFVGGRRNDPAPFSASIIGDMNDDDVGEILLAFPAYRDSSADDELQSRIIVINGETFTGSSFDDFFDDIFDFGVGSAIIRGEELEDSIDADSDADTDGLGYEIERAFDFDDDGILDLVIGGPQLEIDPDTYEETLSSSAGAAYVVTSTEMTNALRSGRVIDFDNRF